MGEEIFKGIIIGIISGIITSAIIWIMKQSVTPKVVISQNAILNDERNVFIVKVINKTRYRLINVSCFMQYYKKIEEGYKTIELKPNVGISPMIERYSKGDLESLYAVQYYFDNTAGFDMEDNDKLVFQIAATHPKFGTSINMIQTYEIKSAIRKNASFFAGKRLDVQE